MARIPRIVLPGLPHHVTQRGNRRQNTFFQNSDYERYLEILKAKSFEKDLKVIGYCLMPNHVHLIVVPSSDKCLAQVMGEVHREYTWEINRRMGWRGFLWQGRFFSCAMDPVYFFRGMSYVELNPVRGGIVRNPEDYPWSSARTHLLGGSDPFLNLKEEFLPPTEWRVFLENELKTEPDEMVLEKSFRSSRPLGNREFLVETELIIGRNFIPKKRGRKPGFSPKKSEKIPMSPKSEKIPMSPI